MPVRSTNRKKLIQDSAGILKSCQDHIFELLICPSTVEGFVNIALNNLRNDTLADPRLFRKVKSSLKEFSFKE